MELLIQTRNKPYEGSTRIELPGGRVEDFESLLDALRREVREETGLELSYIEGQETRIETNGADTNVECIQPFAVYQTLRGPVDSAGVYFRCQAQGELLATDDETTQIGWISIPELIALLKRDPEQFSGVDRSGLAFYLNMK